MSETTTDPALDDALHRLEAMTTDRGETWDLSENDQRAIRAVLDSRAALVKIYGEAVQRVAAAESALGATQRPGETVARAPYTMWSMAAPFRKNGTPVVGTMGSSIRSVVIMEAETFKRLVAENHDLETAEFRVGRVE
ncbi:MAG TPA: hypothetical protein VFN76_09900 [Candidatus Limnocylindria bacterium]|nr:hypothetical protein [Candidatus Limnocylindria bacterium]